MRHTSIPRKKRGKTTNQPKRRATCPKKSHSSFCSFVSSTEILAAATSLSSSTANGPEKVVYPMLKHYPRHGVDFLLHIFYLSWSFNSFPSVRKISSNIPIRKMGKPFNSLVSFWPISLTSYVSKLFKHIVLSRIVFFLDFNFIFSHGQAGFRPVRFTLDQMLFFSHSISDGFNKSKLGSRIPAAIDFSKAFDSVWHQLISACLLLS